ncbi:MFS transporter [Mycobacteroides chelonae]
MLQQGIFVLYLLHRGLSGLQVSLLQTALYISISLASVPVGLFIDRVGARTAAGLGQLVIGATLIGQVVAPTSLALFTILFIGHGAGLAIKDNAELVILYEAAEQSPEDAAIAFPVLRARFTAVSAATVALAIVIGGLLQPVSWTLVYLISGVVSAFSGALAPVLLPDLTKTSRTQSQTPEAAGAAGNKAVAGRWKALRAMGGYWALLFIISSLLHGTLTPFLIFSQDILATQHLPTPAIALTMACVYILGVIAPLLAPRAMQRFPTIALAGSTLTVLAVGLLITSADIAPITVAMVLIAASIPEIAVIALDFEIQDRIPSSHRGALTGVVNFFESLAIASAYLTFGALADTIGPSHTAGTYAAIPAVALALLVLSRFLTRRKTTTG